jgi:uncharacterized protein with HEPN domain
VIDHERFERTTRTLDEFLEFSDAAARLVARGRHAYDNDEMLRLAAEALLHKVGEAVARLDRDDPAFVAAHPEVHWKPMTGIRNLVAHNYGAVDYAIVWTALERSLPAEAVEVARIRRART